MQRVTRYTLCLKQILHYTPQSHPEYEAVTRALAEADKVAEAVNQSAKAGESRSKLEQIASIVDLEGGSEFVREYTFYLLRWLFNIYFITSSCGSDWI